MPKHEFDQVLSNLLPRQLDQMDSPANRAADDFLDLDEILSDLAAFDDEQAESPVAHAHNPEIAPATGRQKSDKTPVERPTAPAINVSEISDLSTSQHMGADAGALVRKRSSHTPITHASALSHTEIIRQWREDSAYTLKEARKHTKRLETRRRNQQAKAEAEAKAEAQRLAKLTSTPWNRLDEVARLPAYGARILSTGRAVGFTILFGKKILSEAEASGNPLGFLHDRITRHLRRSTGSVPHLVLALEESKGGILHVHGLCEWSGSLPALQDLLKASAGTWDNPRGKQHQIEIRSDQGLLIGQDFFDLDQPLTAGWIDYCSKQSKDLGQKLGRKVVYASQALKRQCKDTHEASRKTTKNITSDNHQSSLTDDAENTPDDLLTDESNLTHKHTVATSGEENDYGYAYDHDHEDADHDGRRVRRTVSGHAERVAIAQPAHHDHRHPPGPWAPLVHSTRSRDRRRRAHLPRPARQIRAPAGRAYQPGTPRHGRCARGLGSVHRPATGPPKRA